MKVRDVIRRLQTAGWSLDRQQGSHRQFKHPRKRGTVTVSGGRNDDIAPGTLASIEQQIATATATEDV